MHQAFITRDRPAHRSPLRSRSQGIHTLQRIPDSGMSKPIHFDPGSIAHGFGGTWGRVSGFGSRRGTSGITSPSTSSADSPWRLWDWPSPCIDPGNPRARIPFWTEADLRRPGFRPSRQGHAHAFPWLSGQRPSKPSSPETFFKRLSSHGLPVRQPGEQR